MMPKLCINCVIIIILAVFAQDISAKSVSSSESSEESNRRDPPEALKEFVKVVDKYNLNVTLIGSQKKYAAKGWVKEEFAITLHMPPNDASITQATLTDEKQAKYLDKIKTLYKKNKVGAASRVIAIKDGRDQLKSVNNLNEQYLISSVNHDLLTTYHDGKQGFKLPENETNEVLYNYLIRDGAEQRNVQVITGHVKVKVIDKGEDFPGEELKEVVGVIPKLWMSIDDDILLARLLVQHLDKKFPSNNHQAMIGVKKFAVSTKKFATFRVADTDVLVFCL